MTPEGYSVRAAALAYARRGWSVVPLLPGEKRPLIAWAEFQQRRASAAEIEVWFRHWPRANVGIATGAISNLVVLDIDPRHGGADSLAALAMDHGPLPETVEVVTGGGGRHLYFAHPGGTVPNAVGIAAGIDLRGDGGLVVAPPSRHPSGRRYAWLVGHDPDSLAPAALPAWLMRFAGGGRRGHPIDHWRRLVRQGVEEGARNATIASLTGHLLWHGVDPEVILDLMLAWNRARCRPPLADDEVARTVESIRRTHERGRAG